EPAVTRCITSARGRRRRAGPADECRISRRATAPLRATLQIIGLEPGPQRVEALEWHANLRLPRLPPADQDRRVVRVEIVGVATEFDEEMQVAVGTPSASPALGPCAQLAIGHDIPVALGEAQVRFGTRLVWHLASEDAHRRFVDGAAGEADARFLRLGRVGHARWRVV